MKRRKPGLLIKLVVLGVALYAAVTLVSLQLQAEEQARGRDIALLEIERQKRENALLQEMLDKSGTDEFIADVARSELGYVSSAEKVFVDITN